MEYKDYYKILGVSRSADADTIKQAYRKLARKYHPDRNKEAGAEAAFKEANEAYEVLGDAQRRKAYDALGANWKAGQNFQPPPGWSNATHGAGFGGHMGGGFSDFFSQLFGGMGGATGNAGMGGMFGGGDFEPGRQRTTASRARLAISLEDAYQGAQKSVRIDGRTLQVRIPKGIAAGKSIRLAGQGEHGGDLLLEIEFLPHPKFSVDGLNLEHTLRIAPWEAALGAKVTVPTLGGTVELALPAGTQSGKRMRLKDRGLPGGDQFVTLQVVAPPATTDAQRDAYRELEKAYADFHPRG